MPSVQPANDDAHVTPSLFVGNLNPRRTASGQARANASVESAQSSYSDLSPFLKKFTETAPTPNVRNGVAMADMNREDIREEIKDKVALAEARTAEKITALNGNVQLILQKLENLNGRFTEIRADGNERSSEIRSDVTARISEFRNDMKEDGRSTRNTVIATALTSAVGLAAIGAAIAFAIPSFVDMGMKMQDIKHAQEPQKAPATKTP